ncbi:MAG: hypothetical protein PVI50_04810 [Gammaproteobacteria bacterium]
MKHKLFVLMGMLIVLLIATGLVAAEGQSDLAAVRAATAAFHRPQAAQDAGWDLVPGVDHCFNNPGVGAMGYHYINGGSLDLELDATAPEAMVYAPGPQGQLILGAVEYIVPAAAWDEAYPGTLPTVLGRDLHLNEPLGVYVLHAWIFRHNPDGMFSDWNPNVSCP